MSCQLEVNFRQGFLMRIRRAERTDERRRGAPALRATTSGSPAGWSSSGHLFLTQSFLLLRFGRCYPSPCVRYERPVSPLNAHAWRVATHQLLSGQLGRGPTPRWSYLCDCGTGGSALSTRRMVCTSPAPATGEPPRSQIHFTPVPGKRTKIKFPVKGKPAPSRVRHRAAARAPAPKIHAQLPGQSDHGLFLHGGARTQFGFSFCRRLPVWAATARSAQRASTSKGPHAALPIRSMPPTRRDGRNCVRRKHPV